MTPGIAVLGEALMDCVAQPDGSLLPLMGGSPFNLARAAARRGAPVSFLNPLSGDVFGQRMREQLLQDGVRCLLPASPLPTSLAVVQISDGQASYGFYREGIADRDYSAEQILAELATHPVGVLHTGSLLLVPPEHRKVLEVLQGARLMGWTISVDLNLRPRLAADLPAYLNAVRQVARLAHWLKASDEDLESLGLAARSPADAPALAARVAGPDCRRMALTFGAQGAWLSADGCSASAPAHPVKLVDTVGAGDTFWGNCLADWVLGSGEAGNRVQDTLNLALRAAAINCGRAGCQPPTRAELSA
ncbi:MAG: carbohydrate kinase [Rhodoferax sp.]|nr:carbohydrate kinase [Rhodoferax sp.]